MNTMRVEIADRIARVTFAAPPMNVMTMAMTFELGELATALAADDAVSVVVFDSADPDFFVAHFDVEALTEFPTDGEARLPAEIGPFHALCETLRTMPKATIAMIDGRVGGGGAEISAAMDMRFGSLERCVINQMEVPLGILPGGGGTQRLPLLIGRGRALEIILGGIDLDAATAERWGWLNRALPATELRPYVDALARRIASFPPTAVAEAKAAVIAGEADIIPGLKREWLGFERLLREPEAQRRMRKFSAVGGQTRAAELDMANLVMRLPET
jgi:enoyl-CoA hydratase/carnithine racemase